MMKVEKEYMRNFLAEEKIKLEKTYLKNMRCPDGEILECEYDLQAPYACSLCS